MKEKGTSAPRENANNFNFKLFLRLIERYVFRVGNLLNIVEKVTGIDYFLLWYTEDSQGMNVLARN